MASARSLRSTVESRSPCTASRPSVIAPAACSIALSSFSFASIGRSGKQTGKQFGTGAAIRESFAAECREARARFVCAH